MKETEHYYLRQEGPNRSCLQALRDIILSLDEHVTESIKWGTPCFSYKNRMFCFLALTKEPKTPYLLVVEGMRIEHPLLEIGSRKRMKVLNIDANADLPIHAIIDILQEALNLYRNGVIKTK
ncbi:DUF1801 domain-containing protein [Myroides odoratimimus]|uniref:DUF1801 domain-containing protein n=1 Tax=Myroides odoratimimus TaxID=76832 RepID=UPI0009123BCB|nr:DUF1801 domain-containing protein [Myroides odoratimimus]SHL42600.1 protein of unknown function (DU1801) [Myroides odoratimimus subsp. xuanwuensis]